MATRTRPWALEEQLLDRHAGLASELSDAVSVLDRLETALDEQRRVVAELERRLEAIVGQGSARGGSGEEAPVGEVQRVLPTIRVGSRASAGRDDRLGRCEGFRVVSPFGNVGTVTGVRFGSRVDCPDLLEIELGGLRRQRLLIPVEEVEHVLPYEERVVLAHDPYPRGDLVQVLLRRVRGRVGAAPG